MIRKATRRSTAGRIAPPPPQGWRATARESLLQLIYPRWCPVCHTLLPPNAPSLCLTCQSSLGHYDERTIRALDRLRGAHPMPRRLLAPYLYARDDAMALIVHDIKYHGNKPLARYMGRLMGTLLPLEREQIDYIVPVPLTPDRALERGYNQAILLAEGISSVTGLPYLPRALERIRFQGSQTHRDRTHRLEAMLGSFTLGSEAIPPDSHILLLDDVLTTGATLTAALNALTDTPLAQVSVCVLAVGTVTA